METKNKWFKFSSIKKLLFVVAFFVFIAMPSIQMLTDVVELEEVESFDEKRKMASWDDIQTFSMDTLISSFESYYKDNFGFRNHFISMNNRWKVQHFKISPSESVFIGKDSWYFLDAAHSKKDHLGERILSSDHLSEMKKNLLYKKEYIEKQGGKFYLIVLPDKMSIYSQYLPSGMQNSKWTRFDQVLAYCKGSGIDILDLRPALIAKSKNQLLYQTTDSHWNRNGGFVAYQEIMKHLKKDYPSLDYYTANQFDIVPQKEQSGDLTTIVGVTNHEENVRYTYTPKPNVYKGKVEMLDKYQDYKFSHMATFSFFNPELKQPKLMVLNDSYINFIYPFFGNHFSESHYFWTHNFNESRVDEIQPDIFIQLIIERSLENIVKLDPK